MARQAAAIPKNVRDAMAAGGHRIGVTGRIAKTAVEVTVRAADPKASEPAEYKTSLPLTEPERARLLSHPLAILARRLHAKVNLIPWNPGNLPYRAPTAESIAEFQEILVEKGVPSFIRYSRGQDVFAACGQLALAVTSRVVTGL